MNEDVAVGQVIDMLRGIYRQWRKDTPVSRMRSDWDSAFGARARNWPTQRFAIGAAEAEWIVPPGCDSETVILYFHGGGFRLGSVESHRDLVQRIAEAASARVLALDYRLAPEHRFPAQLGDALGAYRWLLQARPEAGPIAFAGDSAGGGIALSCMLAARDLGLPLPRAAYLLSPWVDLAAEGESYRTRSQSDPMHQRSMILAMARDYVGPERALSDPSVSPLYADLAGLPPLLIQSGGRDVVLDDSTRLAERARRSGVPVDLAVYESMIHVFQMFGELPAAGAAIAYAGRFLRSRLACG
jgi:acetyl esterase/lipase